jgi:Domain of unknown function (DUF4340)
MSPRSVLNLAMAGIAIGLALTAWFRPGLEPPAAPQPLTTLSPAQVSHIRISRLQRPALEFTRQADNWLLAGDPPLPASPFQVNALLAILRAQPDRRYPAASLDLQELGLDPPQATVVLDDEATLLIGNTEPLDNMRYVQYGATIYLVADRYQHLINADRTNFIERRLLDAAAVITRLTLPDLTLTQTADGHWKLVPDNPDISADAMAQLLTNWQQASALYVRPYVEGTTGTRITLELAGNATPVVFELVSRSPEFILARPDLGIQYHFSNGAADRLLVIGAPAATSPVDEPVSN